MIHTVRIAADPIVWHMYDDAAAEALSKAAAEPAEPFAVPVVTPMSGRLVVAPRNCAAIAVLAEPIRTGWVPSDIKVPTARLYVPGAAGAAGRPHGYELPAGTDVAALEQSLIAALRDGTAVTVEVADPPLHGSLTVNGAQVSHVVLCPAAG